MSPVSLAGLSRLKLNLLFYVGVSNAPEQRKALKEYLNNTIVPEIPLMVTAEKIGDLTLILVKVWAGSKQPYIYSGSIYYREGSRTAKASSTEISALIHKRQETELHWERRPALGVELKDLDLNKFRKR